MGINACLNCVSTCCKLEIDLTKEDYERLKSMGKEYAAVKASDFFLLSFPEYKSKKEFLDNLYSDMYATLKKDSSGYCVFLDQDTRLCTIYENRPQVCREYSNNSKHCKNIRQCIK